MKQYLLRASGVAALAFMIHSNSIAQETPPPPPAPVVAAPGDVHYQPDNHQEIIIRKKNDKDIKITVEVKDGQVFINGKPADEYNDDNLSIRKRIIRDGDEDALALVSPDMNMHISPFRGGMSFNGDDNYVMRSNTAFLGVASEDNDGNGAKITGITKGSGAEKAGLKKDDIITKINDIKIDGPSQLTEAIHKFKPEEKVTVTYKRDGKEQSVTAILGKNNSVSFYKTYNFSMPQMEKMKELSDWDRTYAPRAYSFSYNTRPKLGIKAQDTEDGKGVKVLDVDDESPAEKAGIKEGDIITQFDGKPVNSAETLANLARENKDKYLYKINLTRDGKPQLVEVKIPKKLKTTDL